MGYQDVKAEPVKPKASKQKIMLGLGTAVERVGVFIGQC